jgi:hypothetical protein
MAARSRTTGRSAAGRTASSRGDSGLREAFNNVVRALPLGTLEERLSAVESAVARLEREARRVLDSIGRGAGRGAGESGGGASRKKASGGRKKATTSRKKATTGRKKATTGRKKATTARKATTGRKRATTATTGRRTAPPNGRKKTTSARKAGTSRKASAASTATTSRTSAARTPALATSRRGSSGGGRARVGAQPSPPQATQAQQTLSQPMPDDAELASEELTLMTAAPEVPGPLP